MEVLRGHLSRSNGRVTLQGIQVTADFILFFPIQTVINKKSVEGLTCIAEQSDRFNFRVLFRQTIF